MYLKEYRVNYVIIFEANPAYRLAPSGMYILSAILLSIWFFCMIGEVVVLKDYIPFNVDFFPSLLLCAYFLVFFIPLKIFKSHIRFPTIIAAIN